jgi:ABC-type multidrug transport system fused ATPase/permease subunit
MVGVVDGGELVEMGPHADLVAAGGAYSRLYATWVAGTGPQPEASSVGAA